MSKKVLTDLDLENVSKVINCPTPSNGGDAVNKTYSDEKDEETKQEAWVYSIIFGG